MSHKPRIPGQERVRGMRAHRVVPACRVRADNRVPEV